MSSDKLVPVILWGFREFVILSRESYPKQFLRLNFTDSKFFFKIPLKNK